MTALASLIQTDKGQPATALHKHPCAFHGLLRGAPFARAMLMGGSNVARRFDVLI